MATSLKARRNLLLLSLTLSISSSIFGVAQAQTANPSADAPAAPAASPAPVVAPPTPVSPATPAPAAVTPPPSPVTPAPVATPASPAPAPVAMPSTPSTPVAAPPAAEAPAAPVSAPSAPAEEKTAAPAPEAEEATKTSHKKHREEPAKKGKHADDGYYGSMGRSTDESLRASDQARRHKDQGYYNDVKPAINLPVEPPPPVFTPPPPVVQPVAPPRPSSPDDRKFDDDPGKAGSITFTRHANQAKELLGSGHYDLAKKHYKEALRLKEDDVELYPGYWESCMKTNDWSESVRALEKMFKLDPSKEKEYCWAHGVALYNLRKYDQAVPVLKKSLGFGKHLDEVHLCLLKIAQQQKNTAETIAEYNALLKLKPQDYNTQIELAALLENLGKHSDAISHYKQAVAISQTDGATIARLAYMLMLYNKDYDGAISYYNKALMADPKNAQTYNQSIAYANQQKERAKKGK